MKQSNIQIRNAEVENIDLEQRKAMFVISTETVDSYRTVFKLDGWQLDQYHRNPIVCYNHDSHGSDPDTIIGTSRVFREGNKLMAEVEFEQDNSLAEKIMRKVNNGTLRMASVGASIQEFRWGKEDLGEDPEIIYFTKQSLHEWSIVSVGANPDAFKRNDDSLQAIRSEASKDINVTAEEVKPSEDNDNEKRALDAFEAQLIVNQNRLVK